MPSFRQFLLLSLALFFPLAAIADRGALEPAKTPKPPTFADPTQGKPASSPIQTPAPGSPVTTGTPTQGGEAKPATAAPAMPQVVVPLRRLLLADTEANAAKMQDKSDRRVIVQNLSYIDPKTLEKDLEPLFGKPISNELLQQIGTVITLFLRKNDRPVVAMTVPGQDISDGNLRFSISIGRYKELQFHGNRWFSERLLREKIGVREGDEIRTSILEAGVNLINNSPYRNSKVAIMSLPKEPGKANLVVGVAEKIPLNVSLSYDNSGTEVLGGDRYTVAASYANLWGREHVMSYSFMTTDDIRLFRLHQLGYRAPLTRNSALSASLARVDVEPIFADGHIRQKGASSLATVRYSRGYSAFGLVGELSAGFDFSRSDNNLEWLGTTNIQISDTQTDVIQLSLNASAQRRDSWGLWAGGLGLKLSPGGLGARNEQPAYESSRKLAQPRYMIITLGLQRLTRLPLSCQLLTRFNGQLASNNLLGSEQMSIGGMSSVRGYSERVASGDKGWSLTNEVQGPVWKLPLPSFKKESKESKDKMAKRSFPPLLYRLVGFVDAGRVYYKQSIGGADLKHSMLASAGLGLRLGYGNSFSVTCDYGWQLKRNNFYKQQEHSRLHLQGSLSF